jgi:RNA polymerase sigma-70 factor (ECF subfamily)
MSQTAAHNLSDQLLVEQVLKGNQQAFVLVIRQTEGLVAQIVLKMVRITADRPDIVQDIYLKAYKNLPSFRFNSKLSTWIGKIAYNTCLHYLEKRKQVFLPATIEEKEPEEIFDNLSYNRQAYNVNEGEKRLSSRDLGAALGAAINNLSPPIYQTLITLYHQEEMSYAEIAEITSLPEGTVKNYLFRARKALKENLLSDYQKEEL